MNKPVATAGLFPRLSLLWPAGGAVPSRSPRPRAGLVGASRWVAGRGPWTDVKAWEVAGVYLLAHSP